MACYFAVKRKVVRNRRCALLLDNRIAILVFRPTGIEHHKKVDDNHSRIEGIFFAMNATQNAALIVGGLKSAGIKLVATLPDEKMVAVIRAVDQDRELKHVPLCREEEGIGICAGAYLAGTKTALIMQNAGFLNSCNALTTTSLQFQIPTLLLIYYAGDIGDRGFTTLGSVTEPVLQAMGIRSYVLREPDAVCEVLRGAQILAEDSKRPVAVLLTKKVLGVK
jgi:sulfopyruvate decarboxylase subunit alpha